MKSLSVTIHVEAIFVLSCGADDSAPEGGSIF